MLKGGFEKIQHISGTLEGHTYGIYAGLWACPVLYECPEKTPELSSVTDLEALHKQKVKAKAKLWDVYLSIECVLRHALWQSVGDLLLLGIKGNLSKH